MTNAEWVKKFGEPEVVSGIGADWSGYIPSGGWEWQDHFRTNVDDPAFVPNRVPTDYYAKEYGRRAVGWSLETDAEKIF